MKFFVCLFFGLLLSFSTLCQNYIDPIRIEYFWGGNPKFDTSDESASFNELVIDATLPIPLNKKTNLVTGFIIERIDTRVFEDQPALNLSGYTLKLGINRIFSDKWSANFILVPKISSDMENISRKDYQIGTFVLFRNDLTPEKNFKYGFYANAELFGPFLVPVFGFYKKSGPMEINLLLPIRGDINRRIHENVRLGIQYNGFVRSYELDGNYLEKANNELAAYVQFNFKGVNLQILGGSSIGRKFRVYQNNEKVDFGLTAIRFGDDRNQLNTDFKDGLYLRSVLSYRFMVN